ncbi:hypothetical protein PoB_001495000 [Plakobranchus ocellatus]|uniref:Uncharacterized protein n=1 Tax=Plakobranchus ocellatus TaxID=259542 RepID=A0AAV3YZ29_9GAST|nr:hypothetical protein PoB_001495000 [Plakobranchus ocellatus]
MGRQTHWTRVCNLCILSRESASPMSSLPGQSKACTNDQQSVKKTTPGSEFASRCLKRSVTALSSQSKLPVFSPVSSHTRDIEQSVRRV